MKITLCLIALALLLCYAECGYVIYRAYWSNTNQHVSDCSGTADNVNIRSNSPSSSSACADVTNLVTSSCTSGSGNTASYKYRDVCVTVASDWTEKATSVVPPFSGDWVEVRSTAGTLSNSTTCSTALLGSSNTHRGWYRNRVCAFGETSTSFMSRASYNTTAGEARISCSSSNCESSCSVNGVASQVVTANNLACGQESVNRILLVRQVTGSASSIAFGAVALVAAVFML